MNAETTTSAPRPGNNRFNGDLVGSYIERYENIEAEKESEKGAFMERMRRLKEEQAQVLEEAKTDGIPKKPFKSVLKERALQRKLEAIREDLEGEDQDEFDSLKQAIGQLDGTPLGDAALERLAGQAAA